MEKPSQGSSTASDCIFLLPSAGSALGTHSQPGQGRRGGAGLLVPGTPLGRLDHGSPRAWGAPKGQSALVPTFCWRSRSFMNKSQSVFPSKQPRDKGKAEAVPARAVCTGTLRGSAPLSSQLFVPHQLCFCALPRCGWGRKPRAAPREAERCWGAGRNQGTRSLATGWVGRIRR